MGRAGMPCCRRFEEFAEVDHFFPSGIFLLRCSISILVQVLYCTVDHHQYMQRLA